MLQQADVSYFGRNRQHSRPR